MKMSYLKRENIDFLNVVIYIVAAVYILGLMKTKNIIIIFLFLIYEGAFSENLWHLTKNDNGIAVYQRSQRGADAEQFLGIIFIEETAQKIFTIIGDVSSNRYWMADCIHSELIKKISDNEVIAYYITNPPWPVTKRDSVIRIKFNRISGYKFRLDMNALPEGEAEQFVRKDSGMVRIYKMSGFVDIEEKNGKTGVRFGVTGGPGGKVPDFIVKWGGWRIPYNTLEGLRNFVIFKNSQK